jgi:hypothetical protein
MVSKEKNTAIVIRKNQAHEEFDGITYMPSLKKICQ